MATWLIASNLNTYDSFCAFIALGVVCWNEKQVKFETGDTVYIYVAAPISAISIKCEVTAVGLLNHDIEDEEYWKDKQEYADSINNKTWMHLKLIKIFDAEQIKQLKNLQLKVNGLPAGYVLSRQKASSELLSYIKKVELKTE